MVTGSVSPTVSTTTRIETARLTLRTVTLDDVDAVIRSWRLDGDPIPRAEAEERIARMRENHSRNRHGDLVHLCLAVVERETGEFIGWCGLDHMDKAKPQPVLFYLLTEGNRRKGLATEAAAALIRHGFNELGLAQIDGGAAPENVASKRVMEKIGMRYLGPDEEGGHAFSLTREDYFSTATSARC
jgi:RimJ/RimL family protein N-acetyltransferase